MKYWTEYLGHSYKIEGKRKFYDTTIYTFDIETTSYLILNGKIFKASDYLNLTKEEQERCSFQSLMYIWQLSINNVVYYGRTWQELKSFIEKIQDCTRDVKGNYTKKYIFVHNLSYEFQFLRNIFNFSEVFSRKSRKVIKCELENYNVEFRCTYYMSNCSLDRLAKTYNLPVKKLVGKLDYNKIRTPVTKMTSEELEYCENDCLVVYEYIKKELETYKTLKNLPLTSTGHVRKEMKENVVDENWAYINKVRKSININPHVYNLLLKAFAGGYTHANWIYADEILHNISSFDFTSSYPYVMCTEKYPATEFKKCNITTYEQIIDKFAYIITVKFYNIKCKYYNNFISQSKVNFIKNAKFDNGRIIEAKELEITLTDVDLKLIFDTYVFDNYEFIEAYFSIYDYLPKDFIEFILQKYVNKTKLKNVDGMEVEYMMEKNKFNALYGMSVTNNIKDRVIFDNESGWSEEKLTNDEIIEELHKEKRKVFLSFSYGVWVTAHARNNLLRNLIKLDKWVVYADTDSLKLLDGFDKNVIEEYNKNVLVKIDKVCKHYKLDKESFSPVDIKGEKHTLGLFDPDGFYQDFITQGAKKYAYIVKIPIEKARKKDNYNILRTKNGFAWCLGITVSGVPKRGAKALKDLKDFKDNFIFDFKYTNKNMLMYNDDMCSFKIEDYQKNKYVSHETYGACLLPTTYELGKANDYAELVKNESSPRAIYKE